MRSITLVCVVLLLATVVVPGALAAEPTPPEPAPEGATAPAAAPTADDNGSPCRPYCLQM
jgi:hypothetical protein